MIVFIVFLLTAMGVYIQPSSQDDLRMELDNPVSAMQVLSLDSENHENSGPYNRTQSLFNVEPRFFSKGVSWNFIHYPSLPLVLQPQENKNASDFGLGNLEYRGYLTPSHTATWPWGVGAAFRVPTGASTIFPENKFAAGIAVAVVYQKSIMTLGGEGVQLWSDNVNETRVRPIVKVRPGKKTTIGFLDTITVNWNAEEDQRWTIPTGIEVSQLFRSYEDMPVNVSLGAFGNVVRPEHTSDWYWRISVDLVMSK